MKIFGRDPAVFLTQVNGGIIALVLLLKLDDVVAGSIVGVTTAGTALVIAAVVKRDGQLAALVGLGRTVVALAVVLGVDWDPAFQILLIQALETVAGIFIRDRVDAPVDELGAKREANLGGHAVA